MLFVTSPFEVNDTDVVPLTEPAKPSDPPVAVSSTVAPEMVPAAELFKLLAATRLKSVPADDAPETFVEPLSLMFTSPAALALRLATLVVNAALDSPTLPAVEVRFNVGVVMVP